jgi:hypothetical protein
MHPVLTPPTTLPFSTTWNTPRCSQDWRFAEYFAGEAQVSGELHLASYPGVSLDVLYGGGGMDLLTPAGMGFLGER